jgi:hypothetical protein
MEMKNDARYNIKGVRLVADFYGLDTKKTLALDRRRIRNDALREIDEILESAVQFYLDEVENMLFAEKDGREEKENNQIYTYWCMVPLKKKRELLERYKNIFQRVCVQIPVLAKNSESVFVEQEIDFKEVIKELDEMTTIRNLTDYVENKGLVERVNTQLIMELLNKKEIPFSIVVVNKEFSEILNYETCGKIMIISEMGNNLYLMSYTTQERELPELIDDSTKKYLLDNLLKKSDSLVHHGFHDGSVRRYIIGINEYEEICTTVVPFGIEGEWDNGIGYIISPVTTKQWESNKHLERNAFVDWICDSDEFLNLVDHVYAHQVEKDKYSKEEISKKYREFIEEMYSNSKG